MKMVMQVHFTLYSVLLVSWHIVSSSLPTYDKSESWRYSGVKNSFLSTEVRIWHLWWGK